MLDQIKIAAPCTADWEQMQGTDRVRFCAECKKNVYNLSALSRRDAEALLKEKNGDMCARIYRRSDGTVLTEDCPVGFSMKIARARRRVGWAIAGAMGFGTAGCTTHSLQGALVPSAHSDDSGTHARATTDRPNPNAPSAKPKP
jgi:hypothetical protein